VLCHTAPIGSELALPSTKPAWLLYIDTVMTVSKSGQGVDTWDGLHTAVADCSLMNIQMHFARQCCDSYSMLAAASYAVPAAFITNPAVDPLPPAKCRLNFPTNCSSAASGDQMMIRTNC